MPARRSPGTLSLLPTLRFPLATSSPRDLFREFTAGWPAALDTDEGGLWSLGHHEENWGPAFNMTVLAMNLSAARNAVSKLHREVSLEMWGYLFPGQEEPITYVTNGVHTWSWLTPEMAALLEGHGGGRAWREEIERPASWAFVDEIPPDELWETTVLQNTRWSSSSTTACVERPGARL